MFQANLLNRVMLSKVDDSNKLNRCGLSLLRQTLNNPLLMAGIFMPGFFSTGDLSLLQPQ